MTFDPRDISLIKKYGVELTQHLKWLADNPTECLLDQIKYSQPIASIRNRKFFVIKDRYLNQTI